MRIGNASSRCCRAVRAGTAASARTIDCSLMPFVMSPKPAWPGETCPIATATLTASGSATTAGVRRGVWQRIAAALADEDTEWLCIDSSCVRATTAAAGAKKKRTARAAKPNRRWDAAAADSEQKIHAAVTPMGHPVALKLTGGQAGDCSQLPELIAGVPTEGGNRRQGLRLERQPCGDRPARSASGDPTQEESIGKDRVRSASL